MTVAKSLVVGEARGCLVVCQAREAAADDEWDQYMEAMARHVEATAKPRVLVITAGGSPTPEQRKRLELIIHPHLARIKFAIVTDSTFARGVVKAIRLFYPFCQAFALKEMDEALRFLDLRSVDILEVTRHAEELRASLSR
ncbi:MAG: STAS/SEC14 domain-containing protein [Byssovorax sp.]